MNSTDIIELMKAARLSPEQMAERLGISGMTIRRWMDCSEPKFLAKLYERAAVLATYQLVIERKLEASHEAVQAVLKTEEHLSFRASLQTLGMNLENTTAGVATASAVLPSVLPEDAWVDSLATIGEDPKRREFVQENKSRFFTFKQLGEGWIARISSLTDLLRAPKLPEFKKGVAYGALFYLLMPFDLIPDLLPVFGLLDDFSILGIAADHYRKQQGQAASS